MSALSASDSTVEELRELFAGSPLPVVVHAEGAVVFSNQAAVRLFSRSQGSIEGMPVREVLRSVEGAPVGQAGLGLGGEWLVREASFLDAQGASRAFEVTERRLRGGACISLLRDLSNQRAVPSRAVRGQLPAFVPS